MYYKIFLAQMKRSKKTILYLLLLLIAASFFITSVNLYQNSVHNLKIAENTFSTLAITEFYGEVNRYGELVERNSKEHIGYKAVGVKGYDIHKIIDSESVESYDLRSQYGAYIAGHPAMVYAPLLSSSGEKTDQWYTRSNNLIRFKIQSSEPVSLDYHPLDLYSTKTSMFQLDVLDNAAEISDYPNRMAYDDFGFTQEEWDSYSEEIKHLNQTNDTDKLILYPDIEYIAVLNRQGSWKWANKPGTLEYLDTSWYYEEFNLVIPVQDHESIRLTYDGPSESLEYKKGFSPFPLQRLEDVKTRPELRAYFESIWQDIRVQQYTHNVISTNDITSVPNFHMGTAALTDGRFITKKEYEKGAKVCMISEEMAENQQWEIGDKLNMKLFESDYIPGYDPLVDNQPIYETGKTPFIQEEAYEIVGIYSIYPAAGNTELAPDTLALLPYTIYIPSNSISKIRDPKDILVHGSTFSVKLKNGSVAAFQEDMKKKGLTIEKEGQYVPKFTFYDQGYSSVKSSLLSMRSTAKFLLLLSFVFLFIICTLVAYFFWQNQRQTVGIFRLLGGTKKQSVFAVLGCSMLLTVFGVVAGGTVGSGVSCLVGNSIMHENIKEIEMDLSQDHDLSALTEKKSDIRIHADPLVTVAASSGLLLYPLLLLGFMTADIHKEPRELLPKGKS